MERVTFVLHLSLTLTVITAGAIFAIAEARTGIPAITIPVAIVSFLLVDVYRTWRLPQLAQNTIGIVAFLLAGVELLLSDIEAPLLSGGHLLTYLTCAFLLQPKGPRQFWWLAALSLLQVAISSVLTYSLWFGIALPVFVLILLWTASVFQLHLAATTAEAERHETVREAPLPTRSLWMGKSSASNTVQLDDQHRWITPQFVGSMLSGTVLSILLAGVFFLFIPRVWPSTLPIYFDGGRPIGGAPARTGYTSQISLGHVGTIQESPRIAIEARLMSNNGVSLSWHEWISRMGGSPRMRGATQETYESGTWHRWEGADNNRELFNEFPELLSDYVVQEVRIHHQDPTPGGDAIFACGLPIRCEQINSTGRRNTNVELDISSWAMYATGGRRAARTADYRVDVVPWDPWFPNWNGNITPTWRQNPIPSRSYILKTTELDSELRVGLEEWIASHSDVTNDAESWHTIARKWEQWFVYGQDFSYSLNLGVKDPSIDPVLDFLNNTRRGHCEYFASSLAVLLRVYGIPTRVVSGYKGGQVLEDGRLVVRDLHAHLWVEAYLTDAPDDPASGQTGPRWVTLDPTPGSRDAIVSTQERASASLWSQLKLGWQTAWTGAIRMNRADQQNLVYAPLTEAFSTLQEQFASLKDRTSDWWRPGALRRKWFSWEGGLVAFLLLGTLSAMIFGVRSLIRRWTRKHGTAGMTSSDEEIIPFYARMEALLREHGLGRQPHLTPREHSSQTATEFAQKVSPQWESVPQELATRFYSARYGGQRLSPLEVAEIERKLDEVERELDAEALQQTTQASRKKS